jgi:hypothetical protein
LWANAGDAPPSQSAIASRSGTPNRRAVAVKAGGIRRRCHGALRPDRGAPRSSLGEATTSIRMHRVRRLRFERSSRPALCAAANRCRYGRRATLIWRE